MLPLFAAPSSESWGIGELPDLGSLLEWLSSAGVDRLMLLPVGTMAEGQSSPYSAVSSMAIDPIYIGLHAVVDFREAGGEAALSEDGRDALRRARASTRVDYELVRRAKREALHRSFDRFVVEDWGARTDRAAALAGYIARERWWLDDYALYQAIVEQTGVAGWRHWPDALRDRDPVALADVRRDRARTLLRHQYWQWIAESQWLEARRRARAAGVLVYGDLPFMVNEDSAEVWVRPNDVMFDVALGVPPDAFSDAGQDWGLPTYNWRVIADGDYQWLRARARRMAALFDGYRVDHLVGLYRTFGRPADGREPFFNPSEEAEQIRQGETILAILKATGADIIAEDLGIVPDFVRASLARLEVPGCKVLRWERDWKREGHPFFDPATYPEVSAAMTGTHDTQTLAEWWNTAPRDERVAFFALEPLAQLPRARVDQPYDDSLRDAILAMMFRSSARELLLPVQDLFGWSDRINTPGTVGDHNWSWRLPWPVDELSQVPEVSRRTAFLRALQS